MIINDFYSTQRRPQATGNKTHFLFLLRVWGAGGY